jgi:ABC-type lipoprotein export system ATPase subunit
MNIIGGLDRKYEGEVIVNGIKQADKKKNQWMSIGVIQLVLSFNLLTWLAISVS